ncbi:hypothetical protein AB4Y89_00315 [Terriglobus sp. 2YAB30_2]|uniref:hypothetical protein n=1 Tax=Terriglobus sp. 2YAB30_2 TaxID=3233023 RepID=UPI003F986FA0
MPTEFATREIGAAAKAAAVAEPRVTFKTDRSLGAQAYRFSRVSDGTVVVTSGDASGAMYGGLDIAEALRLGTLKELVSDHRLHTPHVLDRGIKFNLPLDWRTPTYSDRTTASQSNIPEMWSMDFWHDFIDEMARDRYNLLSLWSEHPFPSMVKVPEFPDVALDDVWQGKTDANGAYTDHAVVKKMTMDQKIAFWREVMEYAHDRGIAVYIFTWNVFTHGATGKYNITDAMSNATTVAYTRDSVRELIKTYPLLDGMGITSGENMPGATDDAKEDWVWATYGEGARNALRQEPHRKFHIIHRFHQTSLSQIMQRWKDFSGPVDFSYKYSVAHMYSIANPPMIQEALDVLPPGKKMWLEVRNDDIYSFRFGDPDYLRDYVDNMPPAEVSGGYMMGADGYCLGREFLDRDPGPGPHELVIQKQWYSFMLMGRLSYDPTIPDTHFQEVLAARFPGVSAFGLYRALQSASQTMPLITRFFWGDIDIKWFPESSSKRPADKNYYTVLDFAEGESMPGANVLNIRQWRTNVLEKRPMTKTTPLQIADALEEESRATLQSVAALRMQTPGANAVEFRKTLVDCESLAWLAHYYAEKIHAASDLGLYDLTSDASQQASAIRHLDSALDAWKHYATVRDGQYVPALYGRAGYVNITAMTAKVAQDLTIARGWRPGSIRATVPGQTTEPGVKP